MCWLIIHNVGLIWLAAASFFLSVAMWIAIDHPDHHTTAYHQGRQDALNEIKAKLTDHPHPATDTALTHLPTLTDTDNP
jgi:hypothetical protein